MPIVPAGHTYAVVYQFAPAYTPWSSGLGSVSSVYVAPDPINLDPSAPTSGGAPIVGCGVLPEDSASNLVASKATLEGSLLVQQIVDEVATGEQVDAVLDRRHPPRQLRERWPLRQRLQRPLLRRERAVRLSERGPASWRRLIVR